MPGQQQQPAKTSAERQKAWYDRQGVSWVASTCDQCGNRRTDAYAPLCRRCWERLTPEGRSYKAAIVRRSRERRRRVTECNDAGAT